MLFRSAAQKRPVNPILDLFVRGRRSVTAVASFECPSDGNGLYHLESVSLDDFTVRGALLDFLIAAKRAGKTVVGYGAPAKGNTLLNYCGVRTDFLDYTVDRSPHKQGRYLPGTHIPIFAPDRIRETRPDYLLVLPWNIKDEIITQMAHIRDWGGRFVVPVPRLEIVD